MSMRSLRRGRKSELGHSVLLLLRGHLFPNNDDQPTHEGNRALDAAALTLGEIVHLEELQLGQ